ncbi:MAG: MFS transporter, partial [Candidatus Woesearchaeota archaeon]|nr:MFS transporter [Candidatus Woesearchaeota archaeon]
MRQVVYWGLYDLANTIFSALFVTFYFPLYIKNYLGGSEFMIGLVFGISLLTVGVIVPFIGAWSDKVGVRLPFIAFFTVVCCLATLAVPFSGLNLALFLGFIANFCYHAALTVYNAVLPTVSKGTS